MRQGIHITPIGTSVFVRDFASFSTHQTNLPSRTAVSHSLAVEPGVPRTTGPMHGPASPPKKSQKHMGVEPKIGGTPPNWMVYNGKPH